LSVPNSRGVISQTAHKTHKDWAVTERSADLLLDLLGTPDSSPLCRKLLRRVLTGGGWQGAENYANTRIARLNKSRSCTQGPSTLRHRNPSSGSSAPAPAPATPRDLFTGEAPTPRASRPWVVVICGLNGIRKTTSVYQPWFQQLLRSALGSQYSGALEDLPSGDNSFFRQLDYMIATIACEDFRELYEKAGLIKVGEYSKIKDAIFARYRTLAEMIGIVLLKEARLKGMNVMLETSGKDAASFRYVDHLFPNSNSASSWESRDYNKLIVHFTIDDLCFAEQSVDRRMRQEMIDGVSALRGVTHLTEEVIGRIISVNTGGPYGSEVLQGVQTESNKVMNRIFEDHFNDEVNDEFDDWYMARIHIRASEAGWTACSCSTTAEERKEEGREEEEVHHVVLKRFPFDNSVETIFTQ
jgi:hypothetical protein